MQIIGIGGEPATGKSTLIMQLVQGVVGKNKPLPKKLKTCKFVEYPHQHLIVLGVYDKESIFGGTDRLSMAVQPSAENLIKILAKDTKYQNYTILFEGDRLFNASFIGYLFDLKNNLNLDLYLFVLKANQSVLETRHQYRKDKQSPQWLNGRKTKIKNILNNYSEAKILDNNDYSQQEKNLLILHNLILKKKY